MKPVSFESKTTKTRAWGAGRKTLVVECAKNYMHVICIAKPGSKVNGYFSAKPYDFSSLK